MAEPGPQTPDVPVPPPPPAQQDPQPPPQPAPQPQHGQHIINNKMVTFQTRIFRKARRKYRRLTCFELMIG